ncbi:MAG: hypothetical protein LBC28_05690 [Oscillospiraceae bacterium]|nr:hypothetical protein [Oscillospiraceae bacterium]
MKGGNLIELNTDPCKMCMPMGAATALAGVRNCMTILHGSQGCATYIRRHMATHYNEPVDIASSSLTEQGTVFGGEQNLLKGLNNLIELYNPDVIGICTTCLAETIGEDISAIAERFAAERPETAVKLVTVASPGYGGTQNEGYFRALRALVEQLAQKIEPNGRMNVITPLISPADTRWLKSALDAAGVDYILLPDISDNLDGVTARKYERLKSGGTPQEDIAAMGGAALTIELGEFASDADSPGEHLFRAFGVPLLRLPLPIGIQAVDAFNDALKRTYSREDDAERGRYLDAMVDNHKYCARARAAVFGEPDFVKAVVSLCCENGVTPAVIATGSVCPGIRSLYAGTETPIVLDDTDFDAIERACVARNVNLMIGSSDGRRIASRLGIELIRCAFPIHDRVGGQRIRTLGFGGSLRLLDEIANAMLKRTEESFREELYNAYFQEAR